MAIKKYNTVLEYLVALEQLYKEMIKKEGHIHENLEAIEMLSKDKINDISLNKENIVKLNNLINNFKGGHTHENLEVLEMISENKLNDISLNKENIVKLNNLINTFKESQTLNNYEVENNLSTLINNISEFYNELNLKANKNEIGSPLLANSIADMTDKSKVYVNTTDGKWYSWNGSTWLVGGTYNSQGIGENSVTKEMVSNDVITTKNINNLFDKSKVIKNKYIAVSNGAEADYNGFGYITLDISEGSYILVNYGMNFQSQMGACFNDETFVCGLNTAYHVANQDKYKFIKIPSGVNKIKLNFMLANINDIVIINDALKTKKDNCINDERLSQNILNKSDTPFISNILDTVIEECKIKGYYIQNPTGNIITDASFCCLVPFKVKEGEKYLVENYLVADRTPTSMSSRGAFLDINGKFLSAIPPLDSRSPVYEIPTNAHYMSLNYFTAMKDLLTIKRVYVPSENLLIRKECIYPPIVENNGRGEGETNTTWQGKKWTSFGDSITQYAKWQKYVAEEMGLIHSNCGQSSTPVSGSSNSAFHQDTRINAVINNNPDVITILGGANDCNLGLTLGTIEECEKTLNNKNRNTFYGAYSYIIEKLLTWKPSLRIFIMTTMFAYYETPNQTTGLTFKDYAKACKEIAYYYSLPCIDLRAELGLNKITASVLLESDRIHPNDLGGKRIAELVIRELKNIKIIN